jgi:hypothetical protein
MGQFLDLGGLPGEVARFAIDTPDTPMAATRKVKNPATFPRASGIDRSSSPAPDTLSRAVPL